MSNLLERLRERFPRIDEQSATAREIAEELGVSIWSVREELRRLRDSGVIRLIPTRKEIIGLDGRPRPVSAYRIIVLAEAEG